MYTLIDSVREYRLYKWYFTTKEGAIKFAEEQKLMPDSYIVQYYELNDAY